MALYRRQVRDRKTGKIKLSKVWTYDFVFAGRRIKESARTTSKTVAREAERRRRRELEEGYNGIKDARSERLRTLKGLAKEFLEDYGVRQPKSVAFADHALRHVVRLVGDWMAVEITDKTVLQYQTDRLSEGAAPKTINEEAGFLLRLLSISQSGSIRAQLKQVKKLKLKVEKRIGRAFTPEEKAALLKNAKEGRRSRSTHLVTMLALDAGLRAKEIRTLQWNRMNLGTRLITVGQTKTDAGSGRTIPMNDDLIAVAVDYAKWYTGRFGSANSDWYVFPFGKPAPQDPTRPQTSIKTAWRNTRAKAQVEGRFHDNRHTFVTDLAESGVGDQVIQDLVGHVSKDMVKHYSHIRTEAKRRAVAGIIVKADSSELLAPGDGLEDAPPFSTPSGALN